MATINGLENFKNFLIKIRKELPYPLLIKVVLGRKRILGLFNEEYRRAQTVRGVSKEEVNKLVEHLNLNTLSVVVLDTPLIAIKILAMITWVLIATIFTATTTISMLTTSSSLYETITLRLLVIAIPVSIAIELISVIKAPSLVKNSRWLTPSLLGLIFYAIGVLSYLSIELRIYALCIGSLLILYQAYQNLKQ